MAFKGLNLLLYIGLTEKVRAKHSDRKSTVSAIVYARMLRPYRTCTCFAKPATKTLTSSIFHIYSATPNYITFIPALLRNLPMTKRALLLINRHSRKGKENFAQTVELLNHWDFEIISVPLKKVEDIPFLMEKYRSNIDLVIVGGGDGTLNAMVDVLVETQLPLGIIPLGTANDLARTLGIPNSIAEACRIIAEGNLKYIDLGWVNNKYFFNVASLGLSVKITQKLNKGLKRRLGILAYAWTALQVLSKTRPFTAMIGIDGQNIKVKTLQIAIGNGRYYGGGMPIAHDAQIDDQRLDLYSLEIEHWWQIFPLLWTLPRGQQGLLSWVRTLKGKEIQIQTRKPHSINTDGEITSTTPAMFRVIPAALGVYIPRQETQF
jgi:YegS/Rv2252/BmrU family lipid kinase